MSESVSIDETISKLRVGVCAVTSRFLDVAETVHPGTWLRKNEELRAARPDIAELGRSIRQVGNQLVKTAPAEVRADCLTDWREVERLIAELFAWRQPIPDVLHPWYAEKEDGTLVPFAYPVTPEIRQAIDRLNSLSAAVDLAFREFSDRWGC